MAIRLAVEWNGTSVEVAYTDWDDDPDPDLTTADEVLSALDDCYYRVRRAVSAAVPG